MRERHSQELDFLRVNGLKLIVMPQGGDESRERKKERERGEAREFSETYASFNDKR